MGKTDLHIHTTYSSDATTTVRGVLKQASLAGMNVIAVTDHDEIRGSLEARDLAPQYGLEAIPGVEVSTAVGHLIALWVESAPPPDLSLEETLIHIGRQGGVAIAPHPFNHLPSSLSMEALLHVMGNPRAKGVLRGIETDNMATQNFNGTVKKLSIYLPLAKFGASDAHVYWAVGGAYTEFPGKTALDLRAAMESNRTTPVPYREKILVKELVSWLHRVTLRRFGYASDNVSVAESVDTQRLSESFIRKVRKK